MQEQSRDAPAGRAIDLDVASGTGHGSGVAGPRPRDPEGIS